MGEKTSRRKGAEIAVPSEMFCKMIARTNSLLCSREVFIPLLAYIFLHPDVKLVLTWGL